MLEGLKLSDFFLSVSKRTRNGNEDETVEQLELDQKEKQDEKEVEKETLLWKSSVKWKQLYPWLDYLS